MMAHPFLMLGTPELLVIGGAVLLLFGGKKIPELMRSMGQGVKSFKDGMREVTEPAPEQPDGEAVPAEGKPEATDPAAAEAPDGQPDAAAPADAGTTEGTPADGQASGGKQ